MKALYFCDTNKKYYLQTDEPIICDSCGKELKLLDCVVVHSPYTKKQAKQKLYTCLEQKCINKWPPELVNSYLPAFVVHNVPFHCSLVPDVNVEIGQGNGRATVFSAAISNDGIQADCSSCQTVDRTRLAGRESFAGAQIGADVHDLLEQKDKPITDPDEGIALLADIASMQLEGPQAKKQLGHDKTTEAK